MKLIGKPVLHDFKAKHADSRSDLEALEAEIDEAQWNTPQELSARYPKASRLRNQLVVFDVCWNKYRVLTKVNYKNKTVLVLRIGTHKEYNRWDLG